MYNTIYETNKSVIEPRGRLAREAACRNKIFFPKPLVSSLNIFSTLNDNGTLKFKLSPPTLPLSYSFENMNGTHISPQKLPCFAAAILPMPTLLFNLLLSIFSGLAYNRQESDMSYNRKGVSCYNLHAKLRSTRFL